MRLLIELSAEDVNNTTIGIIQQLFAQNTKTDTGAKVDNSRNTIMSDPYSLEDILPEPSSTTKPKQDNATRLQTFAKKIESTLNDKEKRSLDKFVNFYISKINNWKPDVSIQNLWDRWISTEKK